MAICVRYWVLTYKITTTIKHNTLVPKVARHMAICICVFDIFGKQLSRVDSIFDKLLALLAYLTNITNAK